MRLCIQADRLHGYPRPLHARALVLNDGSAAIAILSMDLLGLDFDLVDLVREGIERETGIPRRRSCWQPLTLMAVPMSANLTAWVRAIPPTRISLSAS